MTEKKKSETKNFAAIDIGSNAARLLICSVDLNRNTFSSTKVMMLRYPLRLGMDVFKEGSISNEKVDTTLKLMHIFQHLMEIHQVVDYTAYATSAMRDASNGKELVDRIKRESTIDVKIITGSEEAQIIANSYLAVNEKDSNPYLYVDIGGGSVELTLVKDSEIKVSQSFNIGTIRMLSNTVSENEFDHLKKWIHHEIKHSDKIEIIGLGGNINKLHRLAKLSSDKNLNFKQLNQLYTLLSDMSLEERMQQFKLKPDRADVIVPAAKLFLYIMKEGDINEIKVPTIGVVDGIIYNLYIHYKVKQ